MRKVTVTDDVPASPERLWSLVGDLDAWGEMSPNVTSLRRLDADAAPIGVGSRFAVRQAGLPHAVYEVTAWSPGHSFTWVARSPGVTTTATHVIDAEGSGARLTLGIAWTGPLSGLVRLPLTAKTRRMVESEAETFAHLARGV